MELRVKNICQGYFCHHREFNNNVMRAQQRCFAVCMGCAQSSAVDHGDEDEAGFQAKFTDSEYGPPAGVCAASARMMPPPVQSRIYCRAVVNISAGSLARP
eukprot:4972589-Prymnesium_polylepis.1